MAAKEKEPVARAGAGTRVQNAGSTGTVTKGKSNPTATDTAQQTAMAVAQARPVRNVTIQVGDTEGGGARGDKVRNWRQYVNPNDSIGIASREAHERFEQRGAEQRQRIKDKETMSPHDYAMKHNPGFRKMHNQVQEFAAQEQKRQNDINSGKITDLDKFNKTNWQAAGERDQGKALDLTNGDVARRVAAVEDWQKNQWQTSYDAKTGKSFNRYNDNFDTSRIGGALKTNADGTQSFDFKNMTESQLRMLESVMQKDQAVTGAATRDMNIAMANNKQKAIGEATTRLMDRGVRLTFDPKTGKRLQTDDQVMALDQAYQKVDAAKAVGDLAMAQKTPAGLNDVDTQNKVFRQLIAAGVDPTVARGMVKLGDTPSNVDATGNLHAEGLKGIRDGEKGWNTAPKPPEPPKLPSADDDPTKQNPYAGDKVGPYAEPAKPRGALETGVSAIDTINLGGTYSSGPTVGETGNSAEADKLYAEPKVPEYQPPTVDNPMGNVGDLSTLEAQPKKPGLQTILL
jgi:hypothetical protein